MAFGLAAGLFAVMSGAAVNAQNAPANSDPTKEMQHVDLLAFNRAAVVKGLPLLQKASTAFNAQIDGKCYSCHHQSLPSAAFAYARDHGFQVDAKQSAEQAKVVQTIFEQARPLVEKSATNPAADKELDLILVDPSISVGYALFGLSAYGVKPDPATQAAARYLMRKQTPEGYWPVWSARPPLEASEFTSTALAVRGMKIYAGPAVATDVAQHIKRARMWLQSTRPKTNEDRTFRLLGLRWSGAETGDIKAAAADLLAQQNDDGGWGQTRGAASDAYATGQALVALNQGGDVPVGHSAYRRGTFYLAVTQQKDGSWFVAKRATPVQPFFDAGFPHDQSQFISCAGSAWAVMALALTQPAGGLEPVRTAAAAR